MVRGEPLLSLPNDLYIPPEALEIFLESFEGPLDLLLYLIRKNSLDILDIPMAELTRQYVRYIDAMRASRLELAAEYLVMAAVLIEIKSRMLLPKPPNVRDDDEGDPRAELMRRLLEYERIKLAARALDGIPRIGRDFQPAAAAVVEDLAPRLPTVLPSELRDAWYAVLARARMNRHHRISREELSVREHMTRILRRLAAGGFVEFIDLFDASAPVPIVVVHFVALLELVKEGLVQIMQEDNFAPIYARLATSDDAITRVPVPAAQAGDVA
ncbi:MAG: segregation/condensation protein A [Pseudomonadota bacterium]|nr:segregation/condensation protein A [Pseudomonadota bacterium]